MTSLRNAAQAALAEPVREPVAWMDPNSGEVCRAHWLESHAPERDVDRFSCPLYTTPPQRKPLSGIQVERLLEQVIGSLPVARKLIRAVEAAHGIKE